MLSLLLGIGYIRKLNSLHTRILVCSEGAFEERAAQKVKIMKMTQSLLNESEFFPALYFLRNF